jgi:paraquat-inducible protein A
VVACPDCDAVQAVDGHRAGTREVCYRCGALLAHGGRDRLDHALAYTIAAVPLLVVANLFPLMRMEGQGTEAVATLVGAAAAFQAQHLSILGALMLLATVLLPAVQVAGVAHLLLWLRRGRLAPGAARVVRMVEVVKPWAQIDILFLGLLVGYGKLASVFHMVPGVGLGCLALVLLLERAVIMSFDARHFWERVEATRSRR